MGSDIIRETSWISGVYQHVHEKDSVQQVDLNLMSDTSLM